MATWRGIRVRSIVDGIGVGRGSGTTANLPAPLFQLAQGARSLDAVRSFDPDEDNEDLDVDELAVRQLDDDLVAVDAEQAIALLDEVTGDIAGGGERRAGQREMVWAVAAAISRRRHAVIEAGTGVGKSLGYLVPMSLSKGRVVIATATKNLQDQLATKDAPLLARHSPGLRVAVLKGRANYVCRWRADAVGTPGQLALDDGEEMPRGVADQLRRILEWSATTTSGDRDELPFDVDARAWRQVSVTPHECLGRLQCPRGEECFTERARDRAAASDMVIVNTHLYGAHLSAGSTILPEHFLVVFDEAHQLADIFSSMLGTEVAASRVRAACALARPVLGPNGDELVQDLGQLAERLDGALTGQLDEGTATGLSEPVTVLLEAVGQRLVELVDRLREARGAIEDERAIMAHGPALHLANDVARLRDAGPDELLWLERRDREVAIQLSLVDLGPRLCEELWPSVTAVLTSATIPSSLSHTLGIAGECDERRVASPFDYRSHAVLYVPAHLPARNDDGAESAIAEELTVLIEAAGGRTLALFTNRAVMRRVAEALEPRLATPVLVQDTLSRARLLERFRAEPAASLFAVASYWQGVDVPGPSLSLVAIDRLPFARPDDPLSQARRERAGERAFVDVDLPRAAMLLAQGVGRLIRTSEDRGVVAVLDTRLASASYRATLLERLPPMRRTRDQGEVTAFLREIAADHDARGETQ
jgi:ATP-dependent DNA helicase DinG